MNMVRAKTILVCAALASIVGARAVAQNSAEGPPRYEGTAFPNWGWNGEPGRSELPTPAADASTTAKGTSRVELPRVDSTIAPAGFVADQPATPLPQPESKSDPRRLAPRRELRDEQSSVENDQSSTDVLSRFGLRAESIYSTVTALAFVLGLFFLGIWTLRRGGKNKPTSLPSSVVSVLGRVTLAPKHFAELLRVGNKLVLVSLTPDGPKPITEVTDPAEVDRLTGMCQQLDAKSSSHEFEKMFRELANDRTPGGFLGDEAPGISVPSDLAEFRARNGGRRV
jgi:flagellar biogenesis protein FliO